MADGPLTNLGNLNCRTDANGYLIVNVAVGGATPGGSNTSVQYNDSNVLGGDLNFTWNKTTHVLTVWDGTGGHQVLTMTIAGDPTGGNGPLLLGGTVASPQPMSIGGTSQALYFGASSAGSNATARMDTTAFRIVSGAVMGWSSDANNAANVAADTAIARNAAGVVEVNNGTAGTLRELTTRSCRVAAVAFASLPASPVKGQIAYVTNSSTVVFHANADGAGANNVLCVYDGTNWKVGG